MALIGLLIGLFVLAVLITLAASCEGTDEGIVAGIICMILYGIIIGAILGTQYGAALSREAKIPMLAVTIEEQKTLLGELDQSLGSGLEGLEIKRTIQETIRERNDLIASAQIMRRSAWWVFKPEIVW